MKRSIRININYSNKNKLKTLDMVLKESVKVVNLYIDSLWESSNKNAKFVQFKVETWLSARMQQCLGKQALEIVKSQRKKKKKSKPRFKFPCINLDSRFIDIQYDLNSFDIWIKLTSLGKKLKLKLPSRKHKLFKKYSNWKQLNFIRLMKLNDGKYYIDIIFEKEIDKQDKDKPLGIDIGYKKLIMTSSNKIYGHNEIENIYKKISRRKQGSKNFKNSLKERDNKINQTINNFFNNERFNMLVIEKLKNVKHKTKQKKKINTKFMNKLQRWTYSKVINNIKNKTDERGINLVEVPPAYTSQTCSKCGAINRESRQGEIYRCVACGFVIDADYNASINILHRGVYSPSIIYN